MDAPPRGRFLASLAVPFFVLAVVPLVLLWLTRSHGRGWAGEPPLGTILSAFGLLLIVPGLVLLVATVRLFRRHGKGTIMPWEPTQRLVVRGVYRHVRNPMHIGTFLILFGEGFLLRSAAILAFAVAGVIAHLFYIPLSEERGLERRFGETYREYTRHVPRWLPRLKPWEPEKPPECSLPTRR